MIASPVGRSFLVESFFRQILDCMKKKERSLKRGVQKDHVKLPGHIDGRHDPTCDVCGRLCLSKAGVICEVIVPE